MSQRPEFIWITEERGQYFIDFSWCSGGHIYRYMGSKGGFVSKEDAERETNNWVFYDHQYLMSCSKRRRL